MFFSPWDKKGTGLCCILIVSWSLLPAFQKKKEASLSLAEHNVPLFYPLKGGPYCLKWTFTDPEHKL